MRINWHQRGFTLVEVMIVTVIIAILASLAYPSYRNAIRTAKRSEGHAALLQVMQQQERYYMLHTRYLAFSSDATEADAKRFQWYSGASAAVSAYEMSASPCANETLQDCILLSATPGTIKVDSAFKDTQCGTLSLSSTGLKSPASKGCW